MHLASTPQLAQSSLRVSPAMAAGPEVQAAFAAVMLLSVSHGLLRQPKVQGKKLASSNTQRTVPGSRRAVVCPRAGSPRCEEGLGSRSVQEEETPVEEVTVLAAEEMTVMEYVTFFGYIGGFLAFFYAIGAVTKLFS